MGFKTADVGICENYQKEGEWGRKRKDAAETTDNGRRQHIQTELRLKLLGSLTGEKNVR